MLNVPLNALQGYHNCNLETSTVPKRAKLLIIFYFPLTIHSKGINLSSTDNFSFMISPFKKILTCIKDVIKIIKSI